ncbi:serine hydrolase domain-containing protein [Pontibacter sp. G13]|uniref:serine hydrolase domain-containing protein n=1 Tax=Pontibacter sp. G13 TaxID=3074898 RepID=UPI00288C0454|nr:serine hydrolase domain-containing protein [Pontibacter sp. G13]WNJ18258.1 serine hydrolase domain-containing protein [Pontibacter sp. G13]
MRTFKYILLILLAILGWTAFVNVGTYSGFLLSPITSGKSASSFIEASQSKLDDEFVGNLALVLLEDGEVSQDFYYAIDETIDKNTLFQMASISKWVTSWGVLALAQAGKIDIDAPVENYLTRWHLPESEFDHREVTIRNLLCHTSGLTDGLGYGGFSAEDSVQTIEESLTQAADGYWSSGKAKVGYQPNSQYRYSGGGYTLLQLVVEEVSGQSFNDYMTKAVFEPLNMNRSSFYGSDTSSLYLAKFYDSDSSIAPHYRYTALAAASWYTCTEDLTLFLQAHFVENPVLDQETILMMSEVHTPPGQGMHGLGPMIFGKNGDGDYLIGHDGLSRAAINNAARINLKTRDGIIVLETGSPSFASELANEWGFWKTNIPNSTVMSSNFNKLFGYLVLGYVIILTVSMYIIRRKRKLERV